MQDGDDRDADESWGCPRSDLPEKKTWRSLKAQLAIKKGELEVPKGRKADINLAIPMGFPLPDMMSTIFAGMTDAMTLFRLIGHHTKDENVAIDAQIAKKQKEIEALNLKKKDEAVAR